MSSILAAMRQQKTRYHSPSPVQQTMPESTAERSLLTGLAIVVVGLAAGVAGFYALGPDSTPTASGNTEPDNLVIGAPQQLQLVSLPEAAVAPSVDAQRTAEINELQPARAQQSNATPTSQPAAEALDLDSVSPELLAAFEDALAATADSSVQTQDPSVLPLLGELPERFQAQVPYFSYDAHNYVSDVSRRFLILGGQRLYEGDYFDDLQVVRIEPQYAVLAINRQAFRQTALEDWTGNR